MNKIATITFHWGTNYGAVLQAYALQKVIKDKGYDTEIINYVPFRVKTLQTVFGLLYRNVNLFKKEAKMKRFRKQELTVSKRKYGTNKSLYSCCKNYSAVVVGSDQIWNPSFTVIAEGKPTLSYYLNFTSDEVKRVSYASSFGATKLEDKMISLIKPELERFSAISVRERTGKDILESMGISAEITLDPTLLLKRDDYDMLCNKANSKETNKIFYYVLHNHHKDIEPIYTYLSNHFNEDSQKDFNDGIYEWLNGIKNSEYVLTNSFHGTVFAILFHKPFITYRIKGSGMNDRLLTLLGELGLTERFCEDISEVERCAFKEIDWAEVDKKLDTLRQKSLDFLWGALK